MRTKKWDWAEARNTALLALVCCIPALVVLASSLLQVKAAPAADYHAQNWYVNMNLQTCQDATVGGPMPHSAPVQVLIYPVGSSQPIYANVFFGVGSTFAANIHIDRAMQQWQVVELTYEGAPWLMYNAVADCFSTVMKGPN